MKKTALIPVLVCAMCAACAASQSTDSSESEIEYGTSTIVDERNFSYEVVKEDDYDSRNKTRGYILLDQDENRARYRVFSGEKPTGGYEIDVLLVKEENNRMTVTVQEKEPAPDEVVTEALTYPSVTLTITPAPQAIRVMDTDGTEYPCIDASEVFTRALRTGGTLYLDTGYICGPVVRCGNMDGACQTVLGQEQIPQKDGESNFVFEGWQISGTDTLDVLIDGNYWIFAREDSDIWKSNTVPDRVLQFMAVVEEVKDDQITVSATADGPEFSNIKKGSRFLLPLSAYDPGIYVDMPVSGNPVIVACGGHIEESAEPIEIPWVYQVSPVGSQPSHSVNEIEKQQN